MRAKKHIVLILQIACLAFLACLTIPSATLAQGSTLRFETLSLEDGLSQSVVLAILQDRQGYMWFGTEDGLNRYDGHQFAVYRHDPGDPTTLSDDFVSTIYEDRSGELWIGTRSGLDRVDRANRAFARYELDPEDPASPGGRWVTAICEDGEGTLWIGTDEGLSRLDRATGTFTRYRHDPDDPATLSDELVTAIYQDRSGELWVGTNGGLDRFLRTTETFAHHRHDPTDPQSLSNNRVSAILEDRDGVLWVGTEDGGLDQLDRASQTFIHHRHDPDDAGSLIHNRVRSLFEDSTGRLWVGTQNGLDLYEREQDQFVHYHHDASNPHSLSSNAVWAIYEDQAGVLWFGTYGGGLSKHNQTTEQFALYQHRPDVANSLSDDMVWAITEDRSGTLWIGTFNGGLNRLDRESDAFAAYRHDPRDPTGLSSDDVRAILEDREGVLWVGTSGGLDQLDRATETFTHNRHDPGDPRSLSDDKVVVLHQDQLGNLWVGTRSGGLNRLDRSTGTFVRYQHDPDDPFSLSDDRVWALHGDSTGALWVGTLGGVSVWDPTSDLFTRYLHDPDDPQSLSNDGVFSFYEDPSGAMWMGTWGGGLNRLDPVTQTFTHYTENDGLANDVIYGIQVDSQGCLWLSTNRGLSKFDPRTETFQNYDATHGLQDNEFNVGAHFRSESGEMFFGGIGGFNAFHPEQVTGNVYVPPIVITAFSKFNEVVHTNVSPNEHIQLSYTDNFISFEFAALDYTAPGKNQYAYILEGQDQDWVYAGTRRHADYTNLRGGDYVFRVKGSNNDGVWNEEGIAIHITVTPPFWETWWFRGIALLVLVGSVAGGYWLRVSSIEARSRHLETQVRERTREIEQRTQELEALNAIAQTVSRSLELEAMLTATLDKALEVLGFQSGGIYLRDLETGELQMMCHRGLSDAFRRVVAKGIISARAAESGNPIIIDDLSREPDAPKEVLEEGYRSVASMPLLSKGQVQGVLTAASRQLRRFRQQDVDLLLSIGNQIGVAIENSRLFYAEERRAEQFRVISEVGRRMTSILPVDELLGEIARLLKETLGYYLVGIALIEGDELIFTAGAGAVWETPRFQPPRLKVGREGITGWVAQSGEPLLVPDVSQEPRYYSLPQASEIRSELAVPLVTKERVIGVLHAQSDQLNAFDESDLVVLQSLANQAAIAIENARLYEQAQELAVVEERSRLARDLHDAVTQTLFSASLIAEVLPRLWERQPDEGLRRLDELRELTRGALAEMRTLLLELRPSALVDANLEDLLRQLAESITGRARVPVAVEVEGQCALPAEVKVALYRIAQEALNNVAKHAGADQASVSLRCQPDRVELVIRDDGRGFDPQDISPEHLGLGIMQERAEAVGAELGIDSEIGRGTEITVVWSEDERRTTEDEGFSLRPSSFVPIQAPQGDEDT